MHTAEFNITFREANATRKRYRVLMGGAGSGKSVNAAQDYILKLSDPQYTGCSLLVIRAAESDHLNSTYAELYGAITRLGLEDVWSVKTTPLFMMNKHTGNYILFRGCNDQRARGRLKSITAPTGKICWVWAEEATELEADDFEILDDRLRGKLPDGLFYQLILTFNPESATHWIKKRLWDYDDGNTFRHHSTYLDNRFVDAEYSQRMNRRKELDPEGYRVYALGEWGEVGGVIFTNIEICNLDKSRFGMFSMGVDFGFNHASVCLLLAHKDDDLYILKEVYAKGKTNPEFIALLDAAQMPKGIAMYCDNAEPDRIKELSKAGYKAHRVKKETNSIKRQIEWIKQRKIYIDESCVNTIWEIQAYRWKKDRASGESIDEPTDFDDDCMAALRYGIEGQRKSRRIRSISKEALGIW